MEFQVKFFGLLWMTVSNDNEAVREFLTKTFSLLKFILGFEVSKCSNTADFLGLFVYLILNRYKRG